MKTIGLNSLPEDIKKFLILGGACAYHAIAAEYNNANYCASEAMNQAYLHDVKLSEIAKVLNNFMVEIGLVSQEEMDNMEAAELARSAEAKQGTLQELAGFTAIRLDKERLN